MKLEIYDPPMCCSSGICGPSVDDKLVKINESINYLKDKYQKLVVERYMITQQPMKFKENPEVYKLIKDNGNKVMPITTFNDQVIKTHSYPSLAEMEKRIEADINGN